MEYLGKLVRDEKLPKTFYKFKVRSKFAGITGLPEPRSRILVDHLTLSQLGAYYAQNIATRPPDFQSFRHPYNNHYGVFCQIPSRHCQFEISIDFLNQSHHDSQDCLGVRSIS